MTLFISIFLLPRFDFISNKSFSNLTHNVDIRISISRYKGFITFSLATYQKKKKKESETLAILKSELFFFSFRNCQR